MLIKLNPHRQALESLQQELQQRIQQRQWIDQRIIEIEQAIETMMPLANSDEEPPQTLPQLCLHVLALTPTHGVSVPKIREGLKLMGVDLSAYKNPLGMLHTTLGRLAKQRLVIEAASSPEGTTHYQITPNGRYSLGLGF
jgi:hypothetical protein